MNSVSPGHQSNQQGYERDGTSSTEKLAALRLAALEQIAAAEKEGAFDKPKARLYLEIGANTGAALTPQGLIKAYREGATVVTVDAPKELGDARGHTGFGQSGVGALIWRDSVQTSGSAYDADRIAKLYEDQARNSMYGEEAYKTDFELHTPESSEYRHIALYTDGRDLPFQEGTFGTVLMENILSDPSIPTDTLEDLIGESLRVGDKLTLRNTITSDVAAERLQFTDFAEAGIQVMYQPYHYLRSNDVDWRFVAFAVDLVKSNDFGKAPLHIPDYWAIDRMRLEDERRRRQEIAKEEAAKIKELRKQRLNGVLAKIGLRKKG